MIRRGIHRVLYAPWPQRWLVDVVALALATAILPRIGEGLHVHTASGFALMLVTATAALLAACWALLPPTKTKRSKPAIATRVASEPERVEVLTTSSSCPQGLSTPPGHDASC